MIKHNENLQQVNPAQVAEQIEELRQVLLVSGQPTTTSIRILPLSTPAHLFIGTKPAAVIYETGERVEVSLWRQVAMELLITCNHDPHFHKALLNLRRKVSGQKRYLLSDSPNDMNRPLLIDENLYFEGKFGTEFLIKMLTNKIFRPIGYDYSGIQIELRK